MSLFIKLQASHLKLISEQKPETQSVENIVFVTPENNSNFLFLKMTLKKKTTQVWKLGLWSFNFLLCKSLLLDCW